MACRASSSVRADESAELKLLELPVLSKALGAVKWEMGSRANVGWDGTAGVVGDARGVWGDAEIEDAASELLNCTPLSLAGLLC